MLHGEITTLDLVIVGLYLVAMVAIGVYFVRRIQNTEDYYVADHSFGPLVLMATVCATIIGGSGLMGRAGKAYSGGFMAIMTALPYLLGMFIFSGISGRISDVGFRHQITSIPELFDRRFGKPAKLILAALIAFTMAGAEMWQRAFAAKDRGSAKKGMFLGTSVYGLTIILVFFMGIIGHHVLGEGITNTDSVVPSLAIKVLPMGLTGLALAAVSLATYQKHPSVYLAAE